MSDLSIMDILDSWVKYSEYDPSKKCFNIGSLSYYLHQISDLASKVLADYDKTGCMSIILIKESFLNLLKDSKVPLLDVVENNEFISNTIEMYNKLCSKNANTAYTRFNKVLNDMYKEVIGIDLIGNNQLNQCGSKIQSIIKDIERLKLDVYKKDNKEIHIDKFFKNLLIFNSTGEAVLNLEYAKDGVYTVYINVSNTSDSHFGFFIKSGGNLIEFSDRIDEKYPGQHKRLSVRNGRWADNKSDRIFPYDTLLSYDDYCSKGYAMRFKIKDTFNQNDKNSIPFKDLDSVNGYDNIVLGMLLLKMKYESFIPDKEESFVESLLSNNIDLLSKRNTAIIKVEDSSIAIKNRGITINFSTEQIMGKDEIFNDFKYDDIIRLYGEGFKADTSEIYSNHNIRNLIDDKNTSEVRPEYIGSKERIEKGAYYIIRKQLASYVRNNMEREFLDYGGLKKYKEWYHTALKENIHNIIAFCISTYLESYDACKYSYDINKEDVTVNIRIDENWIKDCYISYADYINIRNEDGKFICPLSGYASKVFFGIKPRNYDRLKSLVNKNDSEIPNLIKVASSINNGGLGGNDLLDMIDPIKCINRPFSDRWISNEPCSYDFRFAIGISKRIFNKLVNLMNK